MCYQYTDTCGQLHIRVYIAVEPQLFKHQFSEFFLVDQNVNMIVLLLE